MTFSFFHRYRPGAILAMMLSLVVLCFASKQFIMPSAKPAKTYPAHDEHTAEKVTAGAEPYDSPEKASIFTAHYAEAGYLPIFLIITNDGDEAVSLSSMQAQLVTLSHAKLAPSSTDDIYRRLSHPTSNGGRTYPLPFPTGKKVKGAVSKETQDEITNSQFNAKAVEPHSTQAGFLFFDVSGIDHPLPGASLFLTGVKDANGNELLYFEVPLQK